MSLAGLLRQTVTAYPPASKDVYGKATFSTGVEYAARVEPATELLRDPSGKEVTVTANVILSGEPTIDTTYKIELPDGSTPVIVGVERNVDGQGRVLYTRVRCSG